jgi:hypothetical protein
LRETPLHLLLELIVWPSEHPIARCNKFPLIKGDLDRAISDYEQAVRA